MSTSIGTGLEASESGISASLSAGYSYNPNGMKIKNLSGDSVDVDDLVNGINSAIEYNVDIINVSLGYLLDDNNLKKSIKKAWDKNIIIVASAGNYIKNDILYPSKYKETLSVGAVDKKGNVLYPKGKTEKSYFFPW